MSENLNKNITDVADYFQYFIEMMYFPYLVKIGILPEEKEDSSDELKDEIQEKKNVILQKALNKLSQSEDRVASLSDYHSMIDVLTGGGIVYKDENGTQFEDLNKAFINAALGNIAALCFEHGVKMRDYSLGEMILPTKAEETVSIIGEEDWFMFINGDAKGFYEKYGDKSKKDLLEQKKKLLEASKVEKEPKSNKITF